MGHLINELRWPEVAAALDAKTTAVFPVGACAKAHGPHLPMNTDQLTADALGQRLAETADVLVWPAIGYGHYPAFRAYAGSTSVPERAFESTLFSLIEDANRHDAERVLLLNTGISTIRACDAACSTHENAAALHVYRGPRYLDAVATLCEQPRGGHADEAETSVMLHLYPERVRMDLAPTWTREMKRGVWSPTDETSASYSPEGIYGDATLATPEKGAQLVVAMLQDIADALAAI